MKRRIFPLKMHKFSQIKLHFKVTMLNFVVTPFRISVKLQKQRTNGTNDDGSLKL